MFGFLESGNELYICQPREKVVTTKIHRTGLEWQTTCEVISEQMQMFGLFQDPKKRVRILGNPRLLTANLIASNYTTYQEEINENILENIDPEFIHTDFFLNLAFSLMTSVDPSP